MLFGASSNTEYLLGERDAECLSGYSHGVSEGSPGLLSGTMMDAVHQIPRAAHIGCSHYNNLRVSLVTRARDAEFLDLLLHNIHLVMGVECACAWLFSPSHTV